MRIIIILFSVALCLAFPVSGGANSTLTMFVDYAIFLDPESGAPYAEIYFELLRHELGFVSPADSNGYQYAGVFLMATAYDMNGRPVDSISTYFLTQASGEEARVKEGVQLIDRLILPLMAGDYRIECVAIDNVSKAIGRDTIMLSVPQFLPGNISLSGIELAYAIRPLDVGDSANINLHLVNDDQLVIPNARRVYELSTDAILYVYAEIYGLSAPDSAGRAGANRFSIQYIFKDTVGNTIHDYARNIENKPGTSAVVSHGMKIGAMVPGNYLLTLVVEDMGTGIKAVAVKPVTLIRTRSSNEPSLSISMEDVEQLANASYYYLSDAEKSELGKLTPAGKRDFLIQFWRQRDNDPTDDDNAILRDAIQRYLYANAHFSTDVEGKDGWRSDRGRVYITYGPYDERDAVELEGGPYPFEKWTYHNLDGRRIFVFVKDEKAEIRDYRLVHSTHPPEKYDPSWERILNVGSEMEDDWWLPGDH